MIKQFKILVIISILILISGHLLYSQQVKVEAQLDTNIIKIGNQVNFRLSLQLPKNYLFRWPYFTDSITSHVEIVRKSGIDTTVLDNNSLLIKQNIVLTSFDSGYYVIPPVKFEYSPSAGEIYSTIETEPYLLNVFTVAVDTTQAIKPIKGPMEAPYTFAELLPWLLLVILLAVVSALVVYYLRSRRKNIPVFAVRPKPVLPPHEIALQALEELKNEKLWQRGLVKQYHTKLTDIIREYIESRFNIRAVEMTTWEILHAFGRNTIRNEELTILGNILETADLVKFAKANPLPAENSVSLTDAIEFVRNTLINKTQEFVAENKGTTMEPAEAVIQ